MDPNNCPCKVCRNFIKNLGYICKPLSMLLLHFTLDFMFLYVFDPRVLIRSYPQVLIKNMKLKKVIENNNKTIFLFWLIAVLCFLVPNRRGGGGGGAGKVGGLENQQNLISVGGAAGLKNYPKFKKLSVFK